LLVRDYFSFELEPVQVMGVGSGLTWKALSA